MTLPYKSDIAFDLAVRCDKGGQILEVLESRLADVVVGTRADQTLGCDPEALTRLLRDVEAVPVRLGARLQGMRDGEHVEFLLDAVRHDDGILLLARHNAAEQALFEDVVRMSNEQTNNLRDLNRELQAQLAARGELERELKISAERYRRLFADTPVPCYVWRDLGSDFELTEYNVAADEITQGTIRDLVGRRGQEIYGREHPEILEDLRRCVELAEPVRREMVYTMRGTGVPRHLLVTYVPLPPDSVAANTIDVTEIRKEEFRRRAADGVRIAVWKMQSEADLEEVIRAVIDGLRLLELPMLACSVSVLDSDTEPLQATFYVRERASGPDLLTWKETLAEIHGPLLRIWRDGTPRHRPDLSSADPLGEFAGLSRYFGTDVRAVLDVPFSHGTIAVNSTVARAFTDEHIRDIEALADVLTMGFRRLQDLRQIRSDAVRHRYLMESLPMGVAEIDPEEGLLYLNPPGSEIAGDHAGDLVRGVIASARQRTHFPYTEDLPLLGDDGTRYMRCIVRRDPDTAVDHLLLLFEDVTESREVEARMRDAQKLEAVGQLTAGIAHNFNNLLMVVINNLEAIGIGADDVPALLHEAEDATTHAAELVEQLMVFSRMERGRPAAAIDLAEVVEGTVSIARRTMSRTIDIRTELPRPGPVVRADATQIEQVVLNLLVNARDAVGLTAAPQIGVELLQGPPPAALRQGDDDVRAFAVVRVTDNGAGIAPEVREHIFEPFFTTKPVGQGTGLGLSTAYGIVTDLGGLIECHSEVGLGSSFTVYLPVSVEPSVPADSATPTAAKAPMRDATLLLVEDEEILRTRLAAMLERSGYRVLTAEDGNAALEIFAAQGPEIDLVLLDLSLPGRDGREVLHFVRQRDPEVSIVLSTGESLGEDLPGDIDGVLRKPYRLSQALETIAELLG